MGKEEDSVMHDMNVSEIPMQNGFMMATVSILRIIESSANGSSYLYKALISIPR